MPLPLRLVSALRYGENPHQRAALYRSDDARPGAASARQVQGKELSYNNLNDADAAFECVAEFKEPAVVIVKHANPCGVALGGTLFEAYEKALACDPVSAFGGIVALNRELDVKTAAAIVKIFTEVVIAPEATAGALTTLAAKPNVRVLLTGAMPDPRMPRHMVRVLAGGVLVQEQDASLFEGEPRTVTQRTPSEREHTDLLFAFTVAKHVKSNAIVYAKGGATVGIGAGQMSRIDAARIAAGKGGERIKGSVMASDAFFPFPDVVEAAAAAGATAIIQPGGSIKDADSIEAADRLELSMLFTGMRHFRH